MLDPLDQYFYQSITKNKSKSFGYIRKQVSPPTILPSSPSIRLTSAFLQKRVKKNIYISYNKRAIFYYYYFFTDFLSTKLCKLSPNVVWNHKTQSFSTKKCSKMNIKKAVRRGGSGWCVYCAKWN